MDTTIDSGPRRPSDDVQVLGAQLLRELEKLDSGAPDADPELCQSYLQHAQSLAWYRVAEGDTHAPREVLECLRKSRSFAGRHLPDLSEPARATAAEIHFAISSLRLGDEAIEQRRTTDRLADSRSATERAVLSVLAANRGTYLRRGQVHEQLQLPDPPSKVRVGQILVGLDEEGLLQRVHARAQGNPDSAFYALSARGSSVCRELGLVPEGVNVPAVGRRTFAQGRRHAEMDAIDQAIRIAIDPASSDDMRRIATGMLMTGVMGGEAPGVWKGLCAALAKDRGGDAGQNLLAVKDRVEVGDEIPAAEEPESPGTFRILQLQEAA